MDRLLQCLRLTLALALLPGTATGQELTDLVRDTKPSVVLLELYDGLGNEVGSGSGFFIKEEGWIVTNYHVIEPASRVVARLFDRSTVEISGVLGTDEANDLAVLQAVGQGFSPLALAPLAPADAGERILVLGSPLGLSASLSEGIVSAIRHPEDQVLGEEDWWPEVPLLQITASISPGSSGSPVMTLEQEVIGVVVSQYLVGQNLNFAIPVDTLHLLLAQIKPGEPARSLRQTTKIAGKDYLMNVGFSVMFFLAVAGGLRFLARR